MIGRQDARMTGRRRRDVEYALASFVKEMKKGEGD
jgi:hypothetical protein